MPAGGVFFLLIILAGVGAVVYWEWYNSTDHCSYDIHILTENAKPIDLNQEKVGAKGDKKWRTTVIFDDGFRYISHKTNVSKHFLYNTISVTENDTKDIIQRAIAMHAVTIKKKNTQK